VFRLDRTHREFRDEYTLAGELLRLKLTRAFPGRRAPRAFSSSGAARAGRAGVSKCGPLMGPKFSRDTYGSMAYGPAWQPRRPRWPRFLIAAITTPRATPTRAMAKRDVHCVDGPTFKDAARSFAASSMTAVVG